MTGPAANEEAIGRLFWQGLPSQVFAANGDYLFSAPGAPAPPPLPAASAFRMGFIDSGTVSRHPQLIGLVRKERTFVDGPVEDELGHGVAVMLIALAGLVAIAGPPVAFYSAKVTRHGDDLRPDTVAKAFQWLVSEGVTNITMSLGFDRLTPEVATLCRTIRDAPGTKVFAAAGNLGPEIKVYPAACGAPNVTSVGELSGGKPAETSGVGHVYMEPTIKLEPRFIFLNEQALRAFRAGREEEARDLWQSSLREQDSAAAFYQLGKLEFQAGRFSEARDLVARAVELSPNDDVIIQMMGAVEYMLGRDDAAIDWYRRAPAINGSNPSALANLARSLAFIGDRAGALETLDQLIVVKPDHPHIAEIRAMIDRPSGAGR
jgi:hypothetical protein